jgi:hypothetical protein
MNALITLAWHITKKDLNASRDLVIVTVLLTITETLLRTVWPPFTMSLDPDRTEWVNLVKGALPPIRSFMFAILVAQLVHADPLAGGEGFWLTRPISRSTLFASKVGTILLAIILPTVLAQVAPMIAFGVPLLDVMRLISEFLLYFGAGLVLVFAGAALTPDGRSLVTWVAVLGILWAVVTIVTVNMSMATAMPDRTAADGAAAARRASRLTAPLPPGQTLTAFMLMMIGGGVVAWHQYRTRRTGRSALIAAATGVILIGVPYVFEPAGLEARTSFFTFTDDPAVPLGSRMQFKDGPRSIVMWPLGDRDGQCGVMVRVTQVRSNLPMNAPQTLSYQFVHRPTQRGLNFTYFALPDRIREMASGQVLADTEARELFQILYRYAVVGPDVSSGDPRDPRNVELKSVACRDVDVIVRH